MTLKNLLDDFVLYNGETSLDLDRIILVSENLTTPYVCDDSHPMSGKVKEMLDIFGSWRVIETEFVKLDKNNRLDSFGDKCLLIKLRGIPS